MSLLKQCADVFAPLIAHLTNRSLAHGVFPKLFKMAQILPLLKKLGLDKVKQANYRPISNLSTISKIVERLISFQRPHLLAPGNVKPLQSTYRNGHSTETALLHTLNSFYCAVDEKRLIALTSSDISAAFDTISHSILLRRLETEFGVVV